MPISYYAPQLSNKPNKKKITIIKFILITDYKKTTKVQTEIQIKFIQIILIPSSKKKLKQPKTNKILSTKRIAIMQFDNGIDLKTIITIDNLCIT